MRLYQLLVLSPPVVIKEHVKWEHIVNVPEVVAYRVFALFLLHFYHFEVGR